jgi:hypothetical protein
MIMIIRGMIFLISNKLGTVLVLNLGFIYKEEKT